MRIELGIPDNQIEVACKLYWAAFGAKLGKVMGPARKGLDFVERVIRPDHAITALDEEGRLLGVAGFKTYEGALVGGTFRDLWAVYGVSALWRAAALQLLERDIENKRFLMDGIFVSDDARGRGVGTALLHALFDEARRRGYVEIRLDVIDTNPRAKALYEREGFQSIDTSELGPLKHLFGFSSATTMVRQLKQ